MERNFLRKTGITLEQLRCFVCVYETLNITRAAEQLAKTQSAVTIALKNFEEAIGVELFNRRIGKNLQRAESAENIYISSIDILKRVSEIQTPTQKSLRIGIPDDLTTEKTLKVKSYFSEKFPDKSISLIVDKNENHTKNFELKNLDFYLHKRLKVDSTSELNNEGEFLYSSKMIWVSDKKVNLKLMEKIQLVSFNEGCIPRKSLEHALALLQTPFVFTYESFSWTQNIEAIKSGFGIGVILDSMFDDDMVELGVKEGFPPLWGIDIFLKGRQELLSSDLADDLRAILKE
jgi:DNA-binding transcriptional LysR family regulator